MTAFYYLMLKKKRLEGIICLTNEISPKVNQ